MATEHTTVWISPRAGDAGSWREVAARACASPALHGEATTLQRVMDRLNRVRDPGSGRGLVDLQWIQALRIEDGEAELTLTFGTHDATSRLLADEAFHAMCAALPDTDIFVQHAG